MLYTVTRPLAKIALGVYFRKIYIVNKEVLPKDKPVILAANHPTAFIEPCILACWLDKPISFIARGDLYVNNFILRKAYDFYHMTPIFRKEDTGYGNLRNNYATFEKCYETLNKKRPLMILVEGRTVHEKRLRPMRKGTARIIGGALEKHGDMDIHLVPVGINYSDSDSFRSVAMIEFGEPIKCTEYTEMFNNQFPKAVNNLTKEMGDRLKAKVIHINDEKDDELVNQFLTLVENEKDDSIFPVASVDSSLFEKQKKIADKINNYSAEKKEEIKIKIEDYHQKLRRNKITDFGLMRRNYASFKNTLFAIIGYIPAMLGYVLNFIPFLFGDLLSKKIAPSIEFRAATFIVFSSFLYLFSGIGLYLAGYLMGFGWKTFWLLVIPALGYFYVVYKDIMKKRNAGAKAAKLNQTSFNDFIRERNDLKKMVL